MKSRIATEIRCGMLVVQVRRVRSAKSNRYTVSMHRLFRNGDRWQKSTRFGQNDIPAVRYLLDKAHDWILQQNDAVQNQHEKHDVLRVGEPPRST